MVNFLHSISRSVSVITYIESFGYHLLSEAERGVLEDIFALCDVLPLTQAIADQSIFLRQQRRIGLGDAIIAATAMVHGLALVTHNTEDFRWIANLELLDPLENNP